MCLFAAGAAAGIGAGMSSALGGFMAIAQIGLGIAQSMAANSAAQAQYQQQVQFRKEQERQAQKTLNLQVAQQQAALESEKDKAQGALADAAIDTRRKESLATTMAAESGVVGLSVDSLKGAILGEGGRYKNRIAYNSKVGTFNAENELKMAQRGHGARLAEIPIPIKPRSTLAIDALGAVVGGLGTYMDYASKGYG